MSDFLIEQLIPILADIGKVSIFISVCLMVINLGKNAFTKGDIRL